MKTVYFDCFSGISGDMILGTLIDLGVEENYLTNELKKLNLTGYHIVYSKKITGGISGSDVDVQLEDDGHDTHHGHHGHHSHRNLADCIDIIQKSSLSPWVKKHAELVFQEVARAESHVHGLPVDQVHFHEVGAVDSIIDIVGAFICLERLGVEKIYSSALHDGHGFITCAHGRMPVPVPAVAQMLASSDKEIPYIQEDIPTELITPTGMAIIKTTSSDFGLLPKMKVQRVGYGTGKRNTGKMNALRGILGEQVIKPNQDEVVLLEANIDNQSSELLGFTLNRLLNEGALDAFFTPIYMKKNRPAVKFSVITKPSDIDKMVKLIFQETTTLGVRMIRCPRYTMNREFQTIKTIYGSVQVKHATLDQLEKWTPEYEDCARLATENHVPLSLIYKAAEQVIDAREVKNKQN